MRSGPQEDHGPSEGIIIRDYIQAKLANDFEGEERLKSFVSERKQRTLEGLGNSELLQRLGAVIPFEGLWVDMLFNFINRALDLNCPDEVYTYISSIKRYCDRVLGGLSGELFDRKTVGMLHGLMPAFSLRDQSKVRECIKGDAFSGLHDTEMRHQLEERLLEQKRVLDFKTFGADLVYIQCCDYSFRQIFDVGGKGIRWACDHAYKYQNPAPDEKYARLWAHVFQNWAELSDRPLSCLKVNKGERSAQPVMKSELCVTRFAAFAKSQGFTSRKIEERLSNFDHTFDKHVDSDLSHAALPQLTCASNSYIQRCGKPQEAHFRQDRKHIVLENLFDDRIGPLLDYPASFAVTQCIFRSFLNSLAPSTTHLVDTTCSNRASSIYYENSYAAGCTPASILEIVQQYQSTPDADSPRTTYSPVAYPSSSGQSVRYSSWTDVSDSDGSPSADDIVPQSESTEHLAAHRGRVAQLRREHGPLLPRCDEEIPPWRFETVKRALQSRSEKRLVIITIQDAEPHTLEHMQWPQTTLLEEIEQNLGDKLRNSYSFVLINSEQHAESRPYQVDDLKSCWHALKTGNFQYAILYWSNRECTAARL